ncbi:MAG: phage portal protein [Ruminococcus sp.]|nr:phage portal protein [Ruminococcus sp.]
MGLGKWVKRKMQTWLEVIPPPIEQAIVIQRENTRELEVLRSQLWYQGDASELFQFFHQTETSTGAFWATAPVNGKVRKIHSGLPAVMANTLAYLVKSDIDDIEAPPEWEDIAEKLDFRELVGQAVCDTLVSGDGAFKISVDTALSPYPTVEFVSGDRVDIEQRRGIVEAVTFKTMYNIKSMRYELHERYSKGRIESVLFDSSGSARPLSTIPALSDIPPLVEFDGDFIMAVPLRFYADKKYRGRGKSIFSGGKSQCFDALDEVISQWLDAVRAGRVIKYIPLELIPRDPDNGSLRDVSSFGAEVIKIKGTLNESQTNKVEVVQPDIRYEAFVSTYTQAMLMCLQGVLSPATLGIDVGKMSSGEAQREKKDVTGDTRNTITSALEKVLPRLINAVLMTYSNMCGDSPEEHDVSVSFGEYGAPDFDSRVETVGKAAAYGIMSVDTQVDELWGGSKDDEFKTAEVQRIKSERGLLTVSEPSVGGA